MRSAYLQLGIPGDAKDEEIEAAFRKAESLFPRERLAEEAGALERWRDLKAAYQVLRDPAARAAHDRKLAGALPRPASRTVIVAAEPEASPLRKVMMAGTAVLALVLAAGAFISYRNEEARKEAAAQEQAARLAAREEAVRRTQARAEAAAQRTRAAATAELNERRLAAESSYAGQRAAVENSRAEADAASARRVVLAEQQRREAVRLSEERRDTYEAQRRAERDKQKVRELCMTQYRRPDC
jgi:hypothetical protein